VSEGVADRNKQFVTMHLEESSIGVWQQL